MNSESIGRDARFDADDLCSMLAQMFPDERSGREYGELHHADSFQRRVFGIRAQITFSSRNRAISSGVKPNSPT